MELKNTVESVVEDTLAELLKNRDDICKCDKCLLDMKAFALNRLPPKYVVSERGLIHAELDSYKDMQFNADVIGTIFEAIDTISGKTRPEYEHKRQTINPAQLENPTQEYYFNFPHIVGFAYINDKLDYSDNIRISLIDEKTAQPVEMMESSWKNPVVSHLTTMGLFSFWPKAIKSDKPSSQGLFFDFTLILEKEGFQTEQRNLQFKVTSEQRIFNFIRKDQIKKIPPIILIKK